ncbi:MAG: oligosaccharide flippase family protein [Anaerovibrio sp.]|uniref:oligosaccharide flippase family protein n=1 Tax=Anaerovibrio sp. TaxID=1872532 RepID=UPI00260CA16F|nr:oligosaccharide flippase family protein [Anaerovibrio sp.]MDD7678701.1 oligosaccharide flippase family protein [Anaerovibrio sp.]MDY2603872.1 oligosaccharide flippase family protein [Anaerovibrio sp.]
MNQLKAGAILSYLNIIINIGVGLVYTPFMMRVLGQSEYGLYALIGSVAAYLNILDMGLANTLVRYTARNRAVGSKRQEAELNGLFLAMYSVIGFLALLAGGFVYYHLDTLFGASLSSDELARARIMTILLVLNISLTFPFSIFASIMQAYERFVYLRAVNILRSLLMPAIMVPLLLLGYGSVAMVAVSVGLNVACLLLNVYYCCSRLDVHFARGHFDRAFLQEIAGYSFFIFLNAVMDKVYWGSGQFVLGIVSGTLQVAVYAVVMQFLMMFMQFSTAISSVFLPKVTMMVAKGVTAGELTDFMIRIGRLQLYLIGMIISLFFLLGRDFICLWAGEGYVAAYPMVLLLMLVMMISLVQNVGISILMAMNLNRYRMTVYTACALISFIASFPAAMQLGGMGCALTTALSLFISTGFFMNRYYKDKIGIDIGRFWRQMGRIWLVIIAFVIMAGGHKYFTGSIDGWLMFFVYAGSYMVFYVLCIYRGCMNGYEKGLLLGAVKRWRGSR